MYLSCSTLACQLEEYSTITEVVRKIQTLGFQVIDLAIFECWQNVDPSWLVENYDVWTENFEKVLAETGIRVSSINAGLSVPVTDPDPASFETYAQEYLTLLKLAERLKCPNITIQPGKAQEGEEFEIVIERAKKRFQALAEFHRDKQITLSVEGHYGSLLESPEAALRMMKALWPAVGFTYDPSHFTMKELN